jgi:hypothetical protein
MRDVLSAVGRAGCRLSEAAADTLCKDLQQRRNAGSPISADELLRQFLASGGTTGGRSGATDTALSSCVGGCDITAATEATRPTARTTTTLLPAARCSGEGARGAAGVDGGGAAPRPPSALGGPAGPALPDRGTAQQHGVDSGKASSGAHAR